MRREHISNSFSRASLACALPFWLVFGPYYLLGGLHISPPGWRGVVSLPGWKWALLEAFSLLLAVIATVIGLVPGAKLCRIALPVAILMFLLTMYIMGP
jgi:hypothetical protein